MHVIVAGLSRGELAQAWPMALQPKAIVDARAKEAEKWPYW